MNKSDVLRNIAQTANLRNRVIAPNLAIFDDGVFIIKPERTDKPVAIGVRRGNEVVATGQHLCQCGNVLVVTDYGKVCRQCVLEARFA